jgi:CDP-diacylglycerol---serine O-phosphatidyltransferase
MKGMKRRKGRGIYLLPNLLTTASLFCGFYSMVATIDKKFTYACVAIFLSAVFDALDGRVARMTGSSSKFGVEYDSLADVIAFGVAPGLLVYMWALKAYGRFGWLAAFLYVTCGALRLARFNTQVDTVQRKQFLGLPIPAAAAAVAGAILFFTEYGPLLQTKRIFMPILVYVLAFLMVSNVRYYSAKDLDFLRTRPFESIVAAVLLFIIILVEPEIMLFVATMGYVVSGPVMWFVRGMRGKKVAIPEERPHSREDAARQDGHL